MSTICWVHPTTDAEELKPLWAKLDDLVRPVLHADTAIEHRFLQRSGNFARALYAAALNAVHMVETAIQAQHEGFDAVVLGCWNVPLWETRQVLDIPVGAISEQATLATLTMGKR